MFTLLKKRFLATLFISILILVALHNGWTEKCIKMILPDITKKESTHFNTNKMPEKVTETTSQPDIKEVTNALKGEFVKKLALPAFKIRDVPDYCNMTRSRGNSCDGPCKRLSIDKDVRTRIAQLVEPPHLQMTSYYHHVLEEMAAQVKGQYDVIIATAASDNHYLESQAQIKNFHEQVFPILKNFTYIYYNLGLSEKNRAQLVKYCKCQVIDFPFSKFPKFLKNLKCYAWKPMIIKAHTKQANVLMWADASVRFAKGPEAFHQLINITKSTGLQFGATKYSDCASRTLKTTFHFFGEEACSYIGRGEIWATFGFYARGYLVERLIPEPWVACAIDRRCMCPDPFPTSRVKKGNSNTMIANWKKNNGTIEYGMAHRFDQSALNIIVMKLYRERYFDVLRAKAVRTRREEKIHYFPE